MRVFLVAAAASVVLLLSACGSSCEDGCERLKECAADLQLPADDVDCTHQCGTGLEELRSRCSQELIDERFDCFASMSCDSRDEFMTETTRCSLLCYER